MAEENKPVDVRKTLELVASQVKQIENRHRQLAEKGKDASKDMHDLAVAVSCLTAIVDGHESRLREIEDRQLRRF